MFLSKKKLNRLQEFNKAMLKTNVELLALVEQLKEAYNSKEEAIRQFTKYYSSKWLRVTCPNCSHTFNFHTMNEKP